MNWIEIIDLRSAETGLGTFNQTLLGPITGEDRKNDLKKIGLYHNASVETDFSIHLIWEAKERSPGKSDLGVRLASALEEFGRVNHSIWIEDEGGER